ncbi:alpha/beta hydrolase [Salipaludibacillus neizhouensis]|uniref:Alpha/beta hydrolase n=1 Tax=Salipaludibacillus neizhouensis TaxID=885475 RepID=A0A3A9KFD2_9BACI|nr:alpha/beta hydrolase [Salipaludibacillus neizhouensis]RKL69291.1 alpha/beta hydrolase [Salipaludibacillus neizhouensis]
MKKTTFTYSSLDGTKIFARKWSPEKPVKPKAVIQIAHGMAEHSERYTDFAAFLVDSDYVVYANDHRGHGYTMASMKEYGYFADENGFDTATDDLLILTERIEQEYNGVPIFLLGHSMGSFLARRYIQLAGVKINGVIISGTGSDPGFQGKLGIALAIVEKKLKGNSTPSPLLNYLTFRSHNRLFEPSRTIYDWLSSDEKTVDLYVDDPLCGGTCSTSFFHDLFTGLASIHNLELNQLISKELPVFIFSGDKDPVGNNGVGVKAIFDMYQKIGIQDISYKLYKNGRHEMLHEVNKTEVYLDVKNWIEARLKY